LIYSTQNCTYTRFDWLVNRVMILQSVFILILL